ncbi:EF-hand domain-containing protein [Streptomyces sp. st140]|uniref:EF-hand domain-containing protein n=1 Tax=Streptomyces sp. st140 TaxID=1828052 RepID=UPI000BF0B02E|nr:EF-hand domain-containing protein [Streptomyces sp. st140]
MDDRQKAQAEGEAKALFHQIDKNQDGRHTIQEIFDYYAGKHPGAMHPAVQGFVDADIDQSESVTEEEFVQHYLKSQA